jgi:hypothetical protein
VGIEFSLKGLDKAILEIYCFKCQRARNIIFFLSEFEIRRKFETNWLVAIKKLKNGRIKSPLCRETFAHNYSKG